jgi:hypothetical protein
MRQALIILATLCLLPGVSHAADAEQEPLGKVTARLGSCVVIHLQDGVSVKPDDVLDVWRAALLGAIAKGNEQVDAWAKWEKTGQIRVRILRGKRFAIATVHKEVPRTGLAGQPVPNILAGDVLRKAATP